MRTALSVLVPPRSPAAVSASDVALAFALVALLALALAGCGGRAAAAPPPATGTTATVTVSATGAGMGAGPLAECFGRWNGAGTQTSGMSWPIEMTVSPPDGRGTCGTIEYPSLGCGGILVGCAVLPDGRVRIEEVYTHNPGTCAPAGEITAICTGGRMSWSWTGSGDYANGTLSRY